MEQARQTQQAGSRRHGRASAPPARKKRVCCWPPAAGAAPASHGDATRRRRPRRGRVRAGTVSCSRRRARARGRWPPFSKLPPDRVPERTGWCPCPCLDASGGLHVDVRQGTRQGRPPGQGPGQKWLVSMPGCGWMAGVGGGYMWDQGRREDSWWVHGAATPPAEGCPHAQPAAIAPAPRLLTAGRMQATACMTQRPHPRPSGWGSPCRCSPAQSQPCGAPSYRAARQRPRWPRPPPAAGRAPSRE